MIAPLRIPNLTASLPIVDEQGRPTSEFLRRLNDIFQSIQTTLNAITQIPIIQQALIDLDAATTAAQNAADAANAAAATAQGDASAAQGAADAAQAAADAAAREAALVNSYIDPDVVLEATPTTITIDPHDRIYGDGTTVSVGGGSVAATAITDVDYVSYSDPTRAGGAVAYIVSTTPPVQSGDTHVVGAVTIPAVGTQAGGRGPTPPGFVTP